MENRAHAFIAGLFVIFLSIAVVFIAMWFSGDSTEHSNYLIVSKEPITGLHSQAAVHYRGVTVGTVEEISFDPENSHQILIDISVSENIILTSDVFAQLGYQGLTGMAFVQLNDQGTVSEPLASGARIPMHRSLLDKMAGSGQDLLGNINDLVEGFHGLLNDNNKTQLSNILTNIEKATHHFDSFATQSQSGIQSLTEFTTETKVVLKHLDQLLIEINQVVVKVNQQGGIIDGLSQSAEALSYTIPELNKVTSGISQSTRNLDRVLYQLEEHPQSLLFGKPSAAPGPGEQGFISPQEASQ